MKLFINDGINRKNQTLIAKIDPARRKKQTDCSTKRTNEYCKSVCFPSNLVKRQSREDKSIIIPNKSGIRMLQDVNHVVQLIKGPMVNIVIGRNTSPFHLFFYQSPKKVGQFHARMEVKQEKGKYAQP